MRRGVATGERQKLGEVPLLKVENVLEINAIAKKCQAVRKAVSKVLVKGNGDREKSS